MNGKEKKENSLLQALLQEYANASQLYTNTIAVTYTRFFGFLAVHGALIVGFFLVSGAFSGQWQLLISIIGFFLAVITFLSIEHVCQFTQFRIAQAKEIEKQINDELKKVGIETEITTFNRQVVLFGKKEKMKPKKLRFPHFSKEESLPEGKWGTWLINWFPYQADRCTAVLLIIVWIVLIIFSQVLQ